ncbi:YceG family protein [Fusobacterium sp. PH5-44]|uniref:YceG family protein n=1 Tax=unclassified Fusobacterium TaxID=2648384 RepID=UPI003D200257
MEEKNKVNNSNIVNTKGIMSTNTWISSEVFSDSLKNHYARGKESGFYYNMFLKIFGVNDKNNFFNNLFKWQLKLKSKKRTVLIFENTIEKPTFSETQSFYKIESSEKVNIIETLANQITIKKMPELENLLKIAFKSILMESNEITTIINNRGIILLCWINRYIFQLFNSEPLYDYPTIIYLGACTNKNENLFIRLLARIPADVFVICPDRNLMCDIDDKNIFELDLPYSIPLESLSRNIEEMKFSTAAANASKELEDILYSDTGLFKVNQFKKAFPIVLETIYEEIKILWNQEAQFRHGFETLNDRVITPTICSKIIGVPNRDYEKYWFDIEKYVANDNCILIRGFPYIKGAQNKNFSKSVTSFIKNKKILVDKIKSHSSYNYRFLRKEIQDYLFEKAQLLIDSGLITGVNDDNGLEYLILNTIFGFDNHLLRMIQNYDFTRQIPKLVIIDTDEEMGSKEDAVFTAFLNLIGFDILLFVPTGYQSIEGHYTKKIFIEHNIGEFMYDLKIPEFDEETREFSLNRGIINLFWRR